MKKISGLFLIVVMIALLVGCGDKHESKNDNKNLVKSKYEIDNNGSISVTDKDFEKFHIRSKKTALKTIDTLDENEYLEANKSEMVIFENNAIAFLLHAVDKPGVNDNTVLVTYEYDSKENKHIEGPIQYNHHIYKDM
ncbi:hypothetical protein [Paraclostridium sordellii]|uniref:Lipoprotein n=2 Tax=Paraclostridium sordellii TaxID=1505 RepID=A0A0C7G4D0_PARSO|nr:hypothetical protein [Paeniclostridium sordellii]CEN78118.1 Uncharacterised protein [[Clostridium] sordellii] [Paeniclostridium sordellii]CEQ03204.1 Uncharacterised protein [[Clostridium] sordellii] [Paeniclostridium sordellii]